MKKQIFTLLCACLMSGILFAQSTWFNDKDLALTGVYYYPEHWDESQWERDFKQMHDLGFEFTTSPNSPGHNWNRKKVNLILPGWTKQSLWQINTN